MSKLKKILVCLLCLVLVFIGACAWYLFLGSKIKNAPQSPQSGTEGTKTLVVYFSRENVINSDTIDATTTASISVTDTGAYGNTELLARMIQTQTGADLYPILTKRQYRSAYRGTAAQAWLQNKLQLHPELAASPASLDAYDTIFIGYPIWWYDAPMAVVSFLEQYDLSGKTVIPFCTNEGSSIDITLDRIRDACPGATVLTGFGVSGHSVAAADIRALLQKLGVAA